jgi:hypothetical protein
MLTRGNMLTRGEGNWPAKYSISVPMLFPSSWDSFGSPVAFCGVRRQIVSRIIRRYEAESIVLELRGTVWSVKER